MKKKAIIATCLSLVLLFALTSVAWGASFPYQSLSTSYKSLGTTMKQSAPSTGTVTVNGVSTATVYWYARFKTSNSTFAYKRAKGNTTVNPTSGQIGINHTLQMKADSSSLMVQGTWYP